MIEQQLYVGSKPKGETPFKGEVPASEFITGNALASELDLTAGISQHSNEPWLKFNHDGKTLFVSKKPYRYSISWNHLNAVGAVFGTKTVVINGDTYKVRLLRGANSDPYVGVGGDDQPGTHGSEWNRLMYPITAQDGVSAEGITFGEWARYSETELVLVTAGGNGARQWCQESQGDNRIIRGTTGVSHLALYAATSSAAGRGWRPCLELVS